MNHRKLDPPAERPPDPGSDPAVRFGARKIIHFDMDAFYPSVEIRDQPHLKGRPVVVGGSPKSRAVVCSASYEARRFGVRSAMPCAQAARLCPEAIFLEPDFKKYQAASQAIREIFRSVTPLVEPLSLDEAYLDVTQNLLKMQHAQDVARYLKDRVRSETGLTGSAGVAPNKFLAKVASDLMKPDGLVVLAPHKIPALLERLPVEKLWGVGPATTKILHAAGLRTTRDIQRSSAEKLQELMGKHGLWIYQLAHGQDDREVETTWESKSRGAETTFGSDLTDLNRLEDALHGLSREVEASLRSLGRVGKTLTLKVRYHDFKTITRSLTLGSPRGRAVSSLLPDQGQASAFDTAEVILQYALHLLHTQTKAGEDPIRLLGLSVSSLRPVAPTPEALGEARLAQIQNLTSEAIPDHLWNPSGMGPVQLEFVFSR